MRLMDQLFIQPISVHELSRFENLLHGSSSSLLFTSVPGMQAARPGQIQAWQVLHDGQMVAVATVTSDKQSIGYVNMAVRPEARRQGVGTRTLEAILNEPGIKHLRYLKSSIDASNVGAQKLLIKNGFTHKGHSPEGYLEFEKRIT
jgi:ribosomal protein S18 acetylase RimI-like enzyme